MNVSDAAHAPPPAPAVPKQQADQIRIIASAQQVQTKTADAVKTAPKTQGIGKVIDIST